MDLKSNTQSEEQSEKFVSIPIEIFNKYFFKDEWKEIEVPDINDVAKYVNVSKDKIKKDLKRYDCPLRVYVNGKRGRGNTTVFFKQSVEHYKEWLENKHLRYYI